METALLVGIISAVVTGFGMWLTFRKSKASLKQQIDSQIDKRLSEELTRAYAEIDELKRAGGERAEAGQSARTDLLRARRAMAGQFGTGSRRSGSRDPG
jgi:hypothetical protein